jgi:hypothetical protein
MWLRCSAVEKFQMSSGATAFGGDYPELMQTVSVQSQTLAQDLGHSLAFAGLRSCSKGTSLADQNQFHQSEGGQNRNNESLLRLLQRSLQLIEQVIQCEIAWTFQVLVPAFSFDVKSDVFASLGRGSGVIARATFTTHWEKSTHARTHIPTCTSASTAMSFSSETDWGAVLTRALAAGKAASADPSDLNSTSRHQPARESRRGSQQTPSNSVTSTSSNPSSRVKVQANI